MSELEWEHIVEVLDVQLLLEELGIDYQQRGSEFWAYCPSPDHKSSGKKWSINGNPGSKFFGKHNCLSCSLKGNAVYLYAVIKKISYADALEQVAEFFGLEDPSPDLFADLNLARRKRERKIIKKEENPEIDFPSYTRPVQESGPYRDYLIEERGFLPPEIERYGVLEGPPGLFTYEKSGKTFKDKYRRVVFPVYGIDGRLLAYFGRSIEKKTPKSLRGRFNKGKGVIGVSLYQWIWRAGGDLCYLLEGKFDSISVARLMNDGVDSFATMTNRISEEMALLIAKNYKTVVFIPDADDGGDRFRENILETLPTTVRLKVATLPDDWDPDDYAREHPEEMRQVIQRAENMRKTRTKIYVDYKAYKRRR